MKLVVMIPAFNDEKVIGHVVKRIPRRIKGIKKVEVLVIDDGSVDDSAKTAKKAGADKVVFHKRNLGLGVTFMHGLKIALEMNADIIVNIDSDNQYDGEEIPNLIQPILEKKCDIVLGSRFTGCIEEMPMDKFIGNKILNFFVSLLIGFKISDAQTGFRAFTKEAASKMNSLSIYTYTQETILEAMKHKLRIIEVPCTFRKRYDNKSRLVPNIGVYGLRTSKEILRWLRTYRPLEFFAIITISTIIVGLISNLSWLSIGLSILILDMVLYGLSEFMIEKRRRLIKNLDKEILY